MVALAVPDGVVEASRDMPANLIAFLVHGIRASGNAAASLPDSSAAAAKHRDRQAVATS
jgi:hypothetical protein